MNEFLLIDNYFKRRNKSGTGSVKLSIGDDAAIAACPPGHELVIATDTLVADVHFPATINPADIGYKALAVNLSDLAAMGASPAWALLNLTMPNNDDDWLKGFSNGVFELLDEFEMNLAGGDTCHGPLNIGITAAGWVTENRAIKRSGAQAGDVVFVSGCLGDAAMGLQLYGNDTGVASELSDLDKAYLLTRLHRPTPRVVLGQCLVGLATSCIDISDGVMADAGHIGEQSQVGMELNLEDLPLSSAFNHAGTSGNEIELAISGGDDYELCFTCPKERINLVEDIAKELDLPITKVGDVSGEAGVRILDENGILRASSKTGYIHFD